MSTDNVLFISFERSATGREVQGADVVGQALGLLEKAQTAGNISRFDAVTLSPNGKLAGFILVQGEAAKLDALRNSPDFEKLLFDASHHLQGLSLTQGITGATMRTQAAKARANAAAHNK